jgi:DnaJ-class molecular chaperone with C-terminal Zn finger domain
MNPFDQLGIPRGSSADVIRSAYRRLAKGCHPDLNPDDVSAAERFAKLQEIYQAALRDRADSSPDMPGSSRARSGTAEQQRHRTVYREVFINVAQAITGCTVAIDGAAGLCAPCSGTGRLPSEHEMGCSTCDGTGVIKTQSKGYITVRLECHECLGKGTTMHTSCHHCGGFGVSSTAPCHVVIPANVRDGDAFRVDGAASIPEENVRGDIEFIVRIRDKRFRIEGDDIEATIYLDIWQTARGCVVPLKLPDGTPLKLRVPPGTASGRRFSIQGKGMPALYDGVGGNFTAVVSIRPIIINSEEIEVAMTALEMAVSTSRSQNLV